MTRGRPILRLLAPRTLWLLVGVILLIEVIYLAEEFTSLIVFIIDVGGTVQDTLILSLLRTHEVIDFALPIAVLIAVYFAIEGARESNELVVCAASGVPWTRIPRFAFFVGLLAFAFSLFFSSTISPIAAKASRVYEQTLEADALVREIKRPGQRSSVRMIGEKAFIATPSPDPAAERGHMFIFEPDVGDGWRASLADDWTVIGPREDGTHAIRLESYRDYVGRTEAQRENVERDLSEVQLAFQNANWDVEDVAMSFRVETLLDPIDRNTYPGEDVLAPALFLLFWTQDTTVYDPARIGGMLARALGCLWAALIAVALAGWSTTMIGRYASIPIGIVAVMGGDVIFRNFLSDAALLGTMSLAQGFAIVLAGVIAVPFGYLALRREAILTPRRRSG